MSDRLDLSFGLSFADLHARDGLVRLDRAFVDWLQAQDGGLANRLLAARAAPDSLLPLDESGLIVDLGPANWGRWPRRPAASTRSGKPSAASSSAARSRRTSPRPRLASTARRSRPSSKPRPARR
jgi:hypothetical protein